MLAMVARNAAIIAGVAILFSLSLAEGHGVKFSYKGVRGPENWGSLSPSFSMCSHGKSQSPINIVTKEAAYNAKLENLARDYCSSNATLINNGFNIGLLYHDGVGTAFIDGKNYSLKQTHWHSPSEHTINGVRYPVELHLVHVADDGSVSVVAILYKFGEPDPFLSQIKDNLDQLAKEVCAGHEEAHIPVKLVRTKSLKRNTMKYFRYVGSITIPPCFENVVWNILGKVREISEEQLIALRAPLDVMYRNNSRPLQPLNGRQVHMFDQQQKLKKMF
ncbi:hypothetical protein GIB67_011825 [Kingdonia uniflora]|uniref:Carbonic anhydrase n=1 Tax=Kingdonia uniflora TaxID=39325 RepID=A0A7J7NYD2_9MAGN|nr:hypothetical protein GIB67_011825 [Kingdonia uniflora]